MHRLSTQSLQKLKNLTKSRSNNLDSLIESYLEYLKKHHGDNTVAIDVMTDFRFYAKDMQHDESSNDK